MRTEQPADIRTRVFISCGQAKGTDEETIAKAIAAKLEALGFDPYIAVAEQTLRGLKENIFKQLENSEYFIFVDFKREQLNDSTPPTHRGSLFSHQELALASFLDKDVLALQETGVKPDDGIIRFLQTNAIAFSDKNQVPDQILKEVKARQWDPRWRNELVLERDSRQFTDANRIESGPGNTSRVFEARFFHIDVRNRHRTKTATNCYVYLARAVNLDNSEEIPLKTIEFKWAGYTLPNAQIPARQARAFDAFWVAKQDPTKLQFNIFSDATDYFPRIQGEGLYRFDYSVGSDNFPTAAGAFVLALSKTLNLTTLRAA